MAAQRTSFDKLQRDRAKKAKAAAKRDRRLNGPAEMGPDLGAEVEGGEPVVTRYPPNLSHEEILRRIEDIHQRFDAGTMSYDEFEEHKAELFGRLTVD
ncbi:MAG: hypothetical protein M3P85_07990 [Actinomycetota bacterium]|jgi:hypothetical protein|nr:hypothetical protein [Actinomycetota bacterium]PLS75838.1 MAG: hypothetical protein CYG61_05250 [Actinomycetota bacterium]